MKGTKEIINYIEKLVNGKFYPLKYNVISNNKKYHKSLADGMDNYDKTHDTSKGYVKSLEKVFDKFDKKDYKKIAKIFCKMEIDGDYKYPGVYLWFLGNDLVYVGETENINDRFENGYGHISPRNVFYGGQSTNCKMNYVMKKYNEKIEIYYMKCNIGQDGKKIEKKILDDIRKINDKSNEAIFMLYNYRGNKKDYRREILE